MWVGEKPPVNEKESSDEPLSDPISLPKCKRSETKEKEVVDETLEVDIDIKTVKQSKSVESSDICGMSSSY